MPECNYRSKHLGLPFCKPANRNSAFTELLQKMTDKLSLWKSRNLSRAGSLVLIKNVAQSILVYHMSSFLIPKNICQKMDSIVRRFWWQNQMTEQNNGFLALKSWKDICRPKNFGGLGLRHFSDFNEALVSKITWNLFQKSGNLWCEILSAKYLRNETDFNSSLQANGGSWVWRDAVKCAKIIQMGACYPVSMHAATRIWEDPWIPSIPLFKPPRPPILNPEWPTLVRDLFDHNTCQWKRDSVAQIFPSHIAREILKIPIPDQMEPHRPYWAPSKSGKFTGKSAFQELQKQKISINQEDSMLGKRIWALQIHNRLKLFVWRTLFDTLPTKGKLNQFLCSTDLCCVFCNFQVETAQHIFLSCPFAERVWLFSKWQVRIHHISHLSLREWFLKISDKQSSFFPDQSIQQEFLISWSITLELIWQNRNDMIFGNKLLNPEQLACCILQRIEDHLLASAMKKSKRQCNEKWIPPPTGWLKINSDITDKNDRTFAAFVVRNEDVLVTHALSKEIFCYNVSLAELHAIRLAVEFIHNLDVEKAIFESDSLVAIQWIKGDITDADFAAQVDVKEIKSLWSMRPKWEFRNVPRLCNGMAHEVAKWAHGANWDGPIPPPMLPMLHSGDRGPNPLDPLLAD